jgi:hypothetical protein
MPTGWTFHPDVEAVHEQHACAEQREGGEGRPSG